MIWMYGMTFEEYVHRLDDAILIWDKFAVFYEEDNESGYKVLRVCDLDDFRLKTIYANIDGDLYEKASTMKDENMKNEAEKFVKRNWENIRDGIYN